MSEGQGFLYVRNTFLEFCEYPQDGSRDQKMRRSKSLDVFPTFDSATTEASQDSRLDGRQPVGGAEPSAEQQLTTVMLRNVACRYKQDDLAAILHEVGFHGCYNFIYAPQSQRGNKKWGKGFVFVDFKRASDVERCREVFHGKRLGDSGTTKLVEVAFAVRQRIDMIPILARHVEHSYIPDPQFARAAQRFRQQRRRCSNLQDLFTTRQPTAGATEPFDEATSKPCGQDASGQASRRPATSTHSGKAAGRRWQ